MAVSPLRTTPSGEQRLAQWMLDNGTPSARVFELISSTSGLAGGARVISSLHAPEQSAPPVARRARLLHRVAS